MNQAGGDEDTIRSGGYSNQKFRKEGEIKERFEDGGMDPPDDMGV